MTRLLQDLRYATRGLLKTPLFTVGIVLTLALGIGVNATMFSVVDALFLRTPTGVQHADGISRVYFQSPDGAGVYTNSRSSYPSFVDIRDHVAGLEQVAAVVNRTMGLGRGTDAIEVHASAVSQQYFGMLGIAPALGRFFTPAEDTPGGDRVAVLSYAFWQRHFGGDRNIVGRVLPLGKGSYAVVGVAPPGFTGIDLEPVEIFLPISPAAQGDVIQANALTSYNWWWMSMIARRRVEVNPATIAAQATLAYRQGKSAGPRKDSTTNVVFGPIQEARGPQTSSDAKVALWIGVVATVVLLIACANVANLLLARGVSRRRELAVRSSLGAGRAGLIRALLSESVVLAAAGGASALVLALWVGSLARNVLLPSLSPNVSLIEPRVLGFTLVAVVLTALATGFVPALQASGTNLTESLRSSGHGTTAAGQRTRHALLVTQVALTLVLLVGAGLFVRSLRKVQAIDLGFDAEQIERVQINMASAGFSTPDANAVYQRLLDRVSLIPGVASAAFSMGAPFDFSYGEQFRAEGVDSLPDLKSGGPYFQAISPAYMKTMGTRILRGRDISESDNASSPKVALVNATFAKLLWPGKDALGKCLYVGSDTTTTCTRIVGVTADVKRGQVTETESLIYFVPFAQKDAPTVNAMFVRVHPGVKGIPAALMREVQGMGNLPYPTIESVADEVAPQLRSWRLGASAFTAFGLLALLIAATGIFAVLSYTVTQRTKEIGVRVALGAQSADVVRLVVGQGMRAALLGSLIGGAGAYALGRALASLLYQVPPTDPAVFGIVIATLLGVMMLASYLPAARASRIAPMAALRSE